MKEALVRRQCWLVLAVLFMALALASCTGGRKAATSAMGVTATPAAGTAIQALVASSDLAVGPNRFMAALVDQQKHALVTDAQLHFQFFKLDGGGRPQALKAETDARPITIMCRLSPSGCGTGKR